MMLYPDVPILNPNTTPETRASFLKSLREVNANRVWIALEREGLFLRERTEYLRSIQDNVNFFRENGVEVGLWFNGFGFGGPLSYDKIPWTRLRSVSGRVKEADAFCPEDPDFTAAYLSWTRDLASVNPDLMMLDDDLCLSVRPGIGCFCDRHLALLSRELGEEITLEDLPQRIFTGGKNRYRDAWHKVMGDTMRNFCRKVREAVDSVNPAIRVGHCAGYTSWDVEGTDAIELARILAGANRPFLRYTGAPYWVSPISSRFPAQKLNTVIECARNQTAWCRDTEVEYFAEADSYPRPCYHVHAALIENFDMAMQADGVRSLNYMLDYYSSPDYEKNYQRMHQRNIPFYQQIYKVFQDKEACGVRLFRPMHRIREAILPERFDSDKSVMRGSFFSMAAAMLTGVGIPVCYGEKSENAAVFGDDALFFEDPAAYRSVILDLPAARLLQEKGVDVGLKSASKAPVPFKEFFGEERVLLSGTGWGAPFGFTGGFFRVETKPGAQIQSEFLCEDGTTFPSAYVYDNGTTRYLVFAFDALAVGESSTVFCSYARQNQLMGFLGDAYPAVKGHADLYALCAQKGETQAVLFENLSCDPVFDFSIELPRPCRDFELFGAKGTLSADGRKIFVETDFHPYSAMVLEVRYS